MGMTDDILATFKSNLRRRRKELGITQKELAEILSYSEKAVSKWENGIALPPSMILPSLADALSCNIDDLLCRKKKIDYYVGVDGGGAASEFVLADSNGVILSKHSLSSAHLTDVSYDQLQEIYTNGIMTIAKEFTLDRISIYTHISGGILSYNKKMLYSLEHYNFAEVKVHRHMERLCDVLLGDDDGMVINLGAGSIFYSRQGDTHCRLGGYGYVLGDVGSGAYIGRDAILAALKSADGSGPYTQLQDLVMSYNDVDKISRTLYYFNKLGMNGLANYAPLVFEAAKMGDGVATDIIASNSRGVANLIRTLGKKFNDAPIPVVFKGGVTASFDMMQPYIEEFLMGDGHRYMLSKTPYSRSEIIIKCAMLNYKY